MSTTHDPLTELPSDWLDRAFAEPAELPPTIYDRSTLQRWAECPQQARLQLEHQVDDGGELATIGSEMHRVISIAAGFRQRQAMAPSDVRETIIEEAHKARPDVQTQVVMLAQKSAWKITRLLCYMDDRRERHPDDLLRYDGGRDDRSGQLAADIEPATEKRGAVRVTGEFDLLMATASEFELDLHDYKSGWRWWTATAVRDAFQFQTYAWLAFREYPQIQRVNVTVHMLGEGESTSPVSFIRERMTQPESRIRSAAQLAEKYRRLAVAAVPAWPSPDKCSLCPVAQMCEMVNSPDVELAADPVAYLNRYAAIQARADQMKTKLSSHVRKAGTDLESEHPNGGKFAFGRDKPRETRAKPCELYDLSPPGS